MEKMHALVLTHLNEYSFTIRYILSQLPLNEVILARNQWLGK